MPAALQFDRAIRSRQRLGIALARGAVFAGGYLAVWAAAGVVSLRRDIGRETGEVA